MIKKNELRINNWLFHTISKRYVQVHTIGDGYPNTIPCINEYSDLGNYEPIPITPELLVKINPVLAKDDFFVEDGVLWQSGSQGEDYQHPMGRCEYVHQLQNLFYSLTGEEMEVSL